MTKDRIGVQTAISGGVHYRPRCCGDACKKLPRNDRPFVSVDGDECQICYEKEIKMVFSGVGK